VRIMMLHTTTVEGDSCVSQTILEGVHTFLLALWGVVLAVASGLASCSTSQTQGQGGGADTEYARCNV
jgi:hypothetical protein